MCPAGARLRYMVNFIKAGVSIHGGHEVSLSYYFERLCTTEIFAAAWKSYESPGIQMVSVTARWLLSLLCCLNIQPQSLRDNGVQC